MTGRRANGSSPSAASGGVRWRWVLAAGAVVGVLPQPLLYPVVFGYVLAVELFGPGASDEQATQFGVMMALWGLPAIQMLLAFFAASRVARGVGEEPVRYGVWVALVSVVVGETVGLFYGPLDPGQAAKYLALALAGGLLGGLEGRDVLAGQEALYRASRAVGAARDPQTIADAIGEHLGKPVALRWSAGNPAEGDAPFAGPEVWSPWFLRGWPEGTRLEGAMAPTGHTLPGRTPRTLRASKLPAGGRAAWKEGGVRSALLVPLVAPDGGEIGLLAVASRRRRFSRGAVRRYQTIAAQAALALENLRLIEEARRAGRQAGVLRERQRMAHEIHDTLAQGFAGIVMNLEAAEGTIPPGHAPGDDVPVSVSGSARLRHHFERARATARESLTEARRLVWALRPEALEEAPLPEALARLAERWSRESGVTAGTAVTGEPRRLPEEVEATLYRVAQEALSNARKHAGASLSRTMLTLSYMGDTVALDVRDDGAGFDLDLVASGERDRASGGFGLRGMRERIEGAGGVLSVESAPGEGTTLAVELPLAVESPAPGAGIAGPVAEPAREAP